jgi:lipopolysaccharide export system protein LptA
MRTIATLMTVLLFACAAQAQVTMSNDKPVEISSDTLDVQQDKHQAIFSGNVIAVQGSINMRADQMIVYYNNTDAPAGGAAPGANGISRIDANGHVIFTNPTDTAKGDKATYMVNEQTLDLTGDVLLTRDKNILKGTRMSYNLQTGRSILTAGGSTINDGKATSNGRVHGLFVPSKQEQPAPQPAKK